MNTQLLIKCIKFYIDTVTEQGKRCPTIEEMKEIVQLDDIKNELIAKFTSKA